MLITGNSPSILRAIIGGIVLISSKLFYRKNDIWTTLAFSLLLILAYNPYLISNAGLQLSYLGAIGIIVFNKFIIQLLNKIHLSIKRKKAEESKFIEGIKKMFSITISAQILIMPVIIYHFNMFSAYFLVSNFLAELVSGPVIMLGFVCVLISFFSIQLASLIAVPVKFGVEYLILVSKISDLPFAKIYFPTPKLRIHFNIFFDYNNC